MVESLTRNEIAALGWSGDAQLVDLETGIELTIRAPGIHDHIDFQTRTPADTAKMLQIAGGTWNWTPRRGVIKIKGRLIGFGFHCMPHSVPTVWGADNIREPPLTRENERLPNGQWNLPGCHFCAYPKDTARIRGAKPGSWDDRMSKAAEEAVPLGNIKFGGEDMSLMEEIRKINGLENVSEKQVAESIGYCLREQVVHGGAHPSIKTAFALAVTEGITAGNDPGMPATRAQAAVMIRNGIENAIDKLRSDDK